MEEMNSKEYWEKRFSTGDWDEKRGTEQSAYFARIAVSLFPEWLTTELMHNEWSFVDYGCAEGSGTAYIHSRFPSCDFTGVDISESAVKTAKERYGFCQFNVGDITKSLEDSDIVFSSNTLEHFKSPLNIMQEMIKHARIHAIFLLPFEDMLGIEEHFSIFTADMFPDCLEEHELSYFQVYDCRAGDSDYWYGKQLLLVYTHRNHLAKDGYSLGRIYRENIQASMETLFTQRERIIQFETEKQEAVSQAIEEQNRRHEIEKKEHIKALEQKDEEIETCRRGYEAEIERKNKELEACRYAYNEEMKLKNDELRVSKSNYEAEIQRINNECIAKNNEINRLNCHIEDMQKAISYRCAAPIRAAGKSVRYVKQKANEAIILTQKAIRFNKQYGIKETAYRVKNYKKIKEEKEARQLLAAQIAQNENVWEELERWIDTTPHEFIDIFGVPMGWNTPLFQRFQHISLQVGKIGGIAFYGAHPQVDKDVETYEFITPTLCIVNLLNEEVAAQFWKILDRKSGLKYIRVQSIDLATTVEKVKMYMEKGYQIVYEYIDELTPQITGNIPKFVYERHEFLLKNEDIIAIATSDKLFNQMKSFRTENMLMLNNGVDYEHWHLSRSQVKCPEDIKSIIKQGKIVIGYHGALAQWIDYDLLNRITEDKRFILLLIGYEHDGRLKKSGLLEKSNVYYIGAKSYQELNCYTPFYDVAILPFLINDITLSVSPVKIFEYMAAEKPVVSYALPECKKYKSCLCANNANEFIDQIEKALRLRTDTAYLNQLRIDALDNTWISITEKMVDYVKKTDQKRRKQLAESKVLNTKLGEDYKDAVLEQMLEQPTHVDEAFQSFSKDKYQRKDGDCKIIAYYLTQFHPDEHNEKWWGKGVTEWNNVCRAVPQYFGHYQPRIPGELGYYDLRIVDNMKRQIELGKMYGIYGFSFYYYWFGGERLLEKPLEMFLKRRELDFPFCICWANENWTRRFDGTNQDVLMEQPKSVKSYQKVIHDILRFLEDPRYIQVAGKKLLIIYRPSLMPEHKKVIQYWRDYCKAQGAGDLYIVAVKENTIDVNWLDEGFDAVSEFHPGTVYTYCEKITNKLSFLRKDFAGEVFSYADIVNKQKYFNYDYPKLYRAVMPMWDNTARRNHKGMIFEGSTPALYKKWLKDVISAGIKRTDIEDNIIFINAWNEWGEGAYLEPDKKYGYAYLQATKEAVEECRETAKNKLF